MTARQLLEALLIELNKVNAPSLLLEDYNYFINKAINQYVNKQYNNNDINQQYTDNVRVLKSTAILKPEPSEAYKSNNNLISKRLHGATYEIQLPGDYLHMLNCICFYRLNENHKCYKSGSYWQAAAKRLTSDSWSTIINDYYNRPTYKRPYYYIHNVNTSTDLPTNPYTTSNQSGTDLVPSNGTAIADGRIASIQEIKEAIIEALIAESDLEIVSSELNTDGTPKAWDNQIEHIDVLGTYYKKDTSGNYVNKTTIDSKLSSNITPTGYSSDFPKTILIGGENYSVVDKDAGVRIGNPLPTIRCEIRYGSDDSVFKLEEVQIDYIKVPQFVELTQEQMDLTQDTSQIMEFPDYVCQEIINELVHLVMENESNQRLQTHNAVSQSIASPTQQQAAQ